MPQRPLTPSEPRPRGWRLLGVALSALALALTHSACLEPELGAQEDAEPVDWLRSYVRLDTSNPPGREHLAAELLGSILRREGIDHQLLVTGSGRTNLYARLRATPGVDGPALLLLHHMDVVAPGSGWSRAPFGGELSDGVVWGRGAIDAKSLGVAHLAAVVALKRRGAERARDVVFLAVADEERGGGEGTGWLLDNHPELFTGVEAVLNEGGSNRHVNDRLLWWGIEVTQKRPLWLRATAGGRGGHGAGFNPKSAVHTLIEGLDRLLSLPPRWKVSAATRTYLEALAPHSNDHWRRVFTNIDELIAEDGPQTGLMPGMPNLFLDTVQVTMFEAADQINVIPAEASASIDVRLLPETDSEAFLAEVRRALGPEVEVEVLVTAPASQPSPVDGELYRLIVASVGDEAPVVPFFSAGFTDSRFFRQRGIAAYGFSPFALEPQELTGIHAVDEGIPVGELIAGVERSKRLVEAWASGR